VSAACFMVCQSDWLPMIMATDFAPSGATEIPLREGSAGL
jgi:hypothetical protein